MNGALGQMAGKAILTTDGVDTLLTTLKSLGYRVVGPRLRDEAIVYDDIASVSDLPCGWTDEQEAGSYRLTRRPDGALFGYAVGPHSWKQFLHPPLQRLWRQTRRGSEVEVVAEPLPEERFAFIGVRACELNAIAIQDRVFLGGGHVDRHYEARRNNTFIVAVNCSKAGGTCFCASMGSGPRAVAGFDIAMTEIPDCDGPQFVVEAGSEPGKNLLAGLSQRPATDQEAAKAEQVIAETTAGMGREMEAMGLRELLMANRDHAQWDEVAERCLTCGNCTMVCPTCFCTAVEDQSDLDGRGSSRSSRWDSCFTMDFSYIHGGSVRSSPRSRYRQWMTHKLATWIDQFGTSGCVGCGRCITWCPVGIDITEEVRAIRGGAAETGS